ncbi:molybdenum ABC transporter ATP-binding protein [Rhizobium sp. CECT 9324]|uniref:molybdenum ABC transporter ATP-binding protein n=1 Tax=Rhizobium sp. CECT 9324 TaxID=2845820 RepID=UPI000DDFA09E|nr:molybdenum ABC transporter ATP-binding protein [Rhizobium sp. CECT 9324]CAH0339768.1 Vitamin B12 import ATP-binding protein BtuD [Rhizobium sp. CECT 9324]
MLDIAIRHQQGGFSLEAELQIGEGLTALFGPSGSGKTTLINMIAGLVRPSEGQIRFSDETWSDSDHGLFLPPHRRRIGYVFQEPRLFPHMTVRQNLAYGERLLPRTERRESLARVADLLRLSALLDRRPQNLSGGEKQRVALGRALMASPRLLLMDEPLSALDSELKQQILPDIERIRDEVGIPIVYVSHSIEEVARLATRVVVLERGRTIAIGAPDAVLSNVPRGAGALPAGNFICATITARHEDDGLTEAQSAAGPLFLRAVDLPPGTEIRVFVPVADIVLATADVGGLSALNRLAGEITDIQRENGAAVAIVVDCGGEHMVVEVTRRSATQLELAIGKPVHLLFKTVSIAPEGLFRRA